MGKRYVILGGGCSFAVHFIKYLLDHADPECIYGIERSWKKKASFRLGIDRHPYYYRNFDVIRDLNDVVSLLDFVRPHTVINFAAEGESRASFDQSWRYFDTNCTGMVKLVEALQGKAYLNRFLHVSTGEVYGSSDRPVKETDPTRPTSPYAASKAAFDAYLMSLVKKGTFRFNIVRPANTYGEGQQLHRFIPKAILYGLTGQRIPLYGSGTGLKSYMHAEDLARALYLLSEKAPLSRIYNIAPEIYVSMRDIAEMIARKLELPISTLCQDTGLRQGTDARYWFDTCAAARDFGFRTEIGLSGGIDRVITWVRDNLEELRELPTEYKRAA